MGDRDPADDLFSLGCGHSIAKGEAQRYVRDEIIVNKQAYILCPLHKKKDLEIRLDFHHLRQLFTDQEANYLERLLQNNIIDANPPPGRQLDGYRLKSKVAWSLLIGVGIGAAALFFWKRK